jgi:2-C-methyl-D-erythritol 4-phosphate cytidylyltransferase
MDTVTKELALQVRIQRGKAIEEFLQSTAYKVHIQGYIVLRKKELIEKTYQVVESHPVLAATVGALHEWELFVDSLIATAADAHLTADDLPEDQSPEIGQ